MLPPPVPVHASPRNARVINWGSMRADPHLQRLAPRQPHTRGARHEHRAFAILQPQGEVHDVGVHGLHRPAEQVVALGQRRATLLWAVKVLLPAFGQASDGPLG